jgi:hypothetical protein
MKKKFTEANLYPICIKKFTALTTVADENPVPRSKSLGKQPMFGLETDRQSATECWLLA